MYVPYRTSHTLTKLTSIYRQAWRKGTGPRNNAVVAPQSLQGFPGKDHCRDKDQWVDRDPPHGPPKGEFGTVFVCVESVDEGKVDHGITKLNGTGYVSCSLLSRLSLTNEYEHSFANSKISITKVPELPYWSSYNFTMR